MLSPFGKWLTNIHSKTRYINPLNTQYSHMGPTHTHIHTCCRPVCCSRRTMEKNPLLPSKSTKVWLTVPLLGRSPFTSPTLNPLPADPMLSLLQHVSESLSSSPTVHSGCLRGAAKQSGLAFSLGGRSWKHSTVVRPLKQKVTSPTLCCEALTRSAF